MAGDCPGVLDLSEVRGIATPRETLAFLSEAHAVSPS